MAVNCVRNDEYVHSGGSVLRNETKNGTIDAAKQGIKTRQQCVGEVYCRNLV